jgi:outer membrane protein W
MKRLSAGAALLLMFAFSAFAQEKTSELTKGHARLSVFSSGLGYTESDAAGSHWQGGVGVAVEYALTDRWSGEVAVAREDLGVGYFGVINPDGSLTPQQVSYRSYPVDAVAQYHFFTQSAWKPFLGVGLRYVNAPDTGFPYQFESGRTSAQVIGGVYYNFTKHLALRLDARQLLRNDDTYYDRGNKLSVGFAWKF